MLFANHTPFMSVGDGESALIREQVKRYHVGADERNDTDLQKAVSICRLTSICMYDSPGYVRSRHKGNCLE